MIDKKSLKRYGIDYIFSFLYAVCFYTPLGYFLWSWSAEQIVAYLSTSIFIAAFSGRLYGWLLNRWRGLFGERKQ